MKSKLYKTHRKPSYYRLRRLGYFSLSLMIATIIVVVPITLAQASTSQASNSSASSMPIDSESNGTSLDSSEFQTSQSTSLDVEEPSSQSDSADVTIPTRVLIEA